jgi:hypothetical protein
MKRQVAGQFDRGSHGSTKSTGNSGMKIEIALIVLLTLTAGFADCKELTVKSNAGTYQVEATLDRYPLVLGDNHLGIEIRDASDQRVADAEVLVNYYMPPMPRMVPMNYKTEADRENGKYKANMRIIMAGPWYIKIIITQGGKITTAKFNVDAQ